MKIDLSWSNSIWFFDVDDTLINTADLTEPAAQAMAPVLIPIIGQDTAQQIIQSFIDNYNLLQTGHRIAQPSDWTDPELKTKHDAYIKQIESHQPHLIEQGVYKKWSREVFIKIAALEHNVELTPTQVLQSTEAYWTAIAQQSLLLSGVLDLFKEIKAHNRPIFLVTGSDANLQFDDQGKLHYDATYSENYKLKRVLPLKNQGLEFESVIIGDPIDKPHKEFFEKALRIAENHLHQAIDPQNVIIVGDSYGSDLHTPKTELNFGLVVQYINKQPDTKFIDDRHITTGNLAEIGKLLTK